MWRHVIWAEGDAIAVLQDVEISGNQVFFSALLPEQTGHQTTPSSDEIGSIAI